MPNVLARSWLAKAIEYVHLQFQCEILIVNVYRNVTIKLNMFN